MGALMQKGIYINDSIHGLIRLSEFEKQIISSVGFNRLHDVYQNSTVYLTYPSNRTKRFEHSIGTMKLCSDMFFYSIENATEDNIIKFYDLYTRELNKIIKGIKRNIKEYDFLKKSPKDFPQINLDSFRLSLIPRKVPKDMENVHVILMESVRVAALLHDIGHPPFSHVVERAMKTAYNTSKDKKTKSWKTYREKMKEYFEDDRALHEVMGDEITKNILKETAKATSKDDNGQESLFRVIVLECVLKMYDEASQNAFNSLHRLIDGSVDGDRLDYVTRDPINSGINNGFIDYSRIILDMQMIMDDKTNHPRFCIPVKAVNAVEDFLKRRYDLYKKIIYHHRVIKTDYLLEHSVTNLINVYMEKKSGTSDDTDFIPFDISGLWYPLGEATIEEKGNELSQWNDSWLMTILKKIYFTEYYIPNGLLDSRGELIKGQLAELLRHEKSYHSLVKRSEDFQVIDKEVRKVLKDNCEELNDKVEKLNQTSRDSSKLIEKKEKLSSVAVIDIKGTLSAVEELLKGVELDGEGFIVSFVRNHQKLLGMLDFEEKVIHLVSEACASKFPSTHDTITVFKNVSVGTDNHAIFFYDSNQNIYALDDLSGVASSLRKENDFRPIFYIYTFNDETTDTFLSTKNSLLENIGDLIGDYIVEQLKGLFTKLNNQIKKEIVYVQGDC